MRGILFILAMLDRSMCADYNDTIMQEIYQKLQEHDRRFDEHDKRFDAIDKRFDKIEGQLDLVATKVFEHDGRLDRIEQRLENTATKDDVSKVMSVLDKLVKMYETHTQEVTLLSQDLRRVEDKVEEHDRDIKIMKPALGLS